MSTQDSLTYRLRDYIAGSVGGITQVLIGQPFDTIKVRLQSSAGQLSITECIKDLVQHEGMSAFYKGVASPLVCMCAVISIQFGVFQQSMRELKIIQNLKELPIYQLSLCGALSGIACTPLVSPMEHIRIKMQVMKDHAYKNTFQCAQSVIKQHGIKGIYRGLNATFLREIPGEAVYFLAYEYQMRHIRGWLREHPQFLTYAPLFAGGVSGLVFWMVCYPIDTLKSRLQGDNLSAPKYKNFMDAYKQSIEKEGFQSLFKGVKVCAIRSVPVNACGFLAFEETKLLIEKSHQKHLHQH